MFGNFLTKIYLKHLERKGFVHGTNFDMKKGVNIDASKKSLAKYRRNMGSKQENNRISYIE